MSGYGQYALGYHDRGWSPLPLPHGAKWPPPDGMTGATAPAAERSDVEHWVATRADANIALRLPERVIGIDVDAYKPNAVATMQRLEAAAPMPPTWRSSSRGTAGDVPYESGIYLYRIPDDIPLDLVAKMRDPRGADGTTKDSDVELIRHGHRYIVAAPSMSPPPPKGSGQPYVWYAPDGSNRAPSVHELPFLPREWISFLTPAVAAPAAASSAPVSVEAANAYEQRAVQANIDRLRAMSAAATPDGSGYTGEPWDGTTFYVACRLLELANASWTSLTPDLVEALLLEHAPRDASFDDRAVLAKLASARSRIGDRAADAPTGAGRVDDSSLFRSRAQGGEASAVAPAARTITHDGAVDVTNEALAALWLRDEVGTGRLAGMFFRKGELVYTPRIGEEGYISPRDMRAENAASISLMEESQLQARIQNRYVVTRLTEDREATKRAKAADPDAGPVFNPKPAIFPVGAARIVAKAPDDCPNLRTLHGVTHSPTLRPDGTIITTPGYDQSTGLLYLPVGEQPAAVPDTPTTDHLRIATSWIAYMLQDFAFVSDDDRATYIGLMLTPLLRALIPPPYKLGIIEAHERGSGKSFLARALTSLHGGAMQPEMPSDDVELGKVIASILDTQTAPVVVFDNVSGFVRSSVLAGLLTSPTFQSRRLGSSTVIEADNDRLWVLTGNNATIGGDLGRRNVRVRLDPGVPNPELRTGFAIADFESWVREHRGELLWSLLVMVRSWVVNGMLFVDEPIADTYGRWVATVRGILANAGIPGLFSNPDVQQFAVDPEVEEWGGFLERVHELKGEEPWTVKGLLTLVAHPLTSIADPARPIPFDALPSGLLGSRAIMDPGQLAGSLGKWLSNRQGRWYGTLTVKTVSERTKTGKLWRVESYKR